MNTFVYDSGPAERIPQLAELQEYQEQIVKARITGRIAKGIYEDQIRKVGTDLAAAGLLEGEAVLDLVEIELLLEFGTWMFANAASLWASASIENESRIQRALFAKWADRF